MHLFLFQVVEACEENELPGGWGGVLTLKVFYMHKGSLCQQYLITGTSL